MLRVMGRRMMGTTGGQRASGVISGVGAVLVSTAAAVGIPMDGAWHTVIESTGGGSGIGLTSPVYVIDGGAAARVYITDWAVPFEWYTVYLGGTTAGPILTVTPVVARNDLIVENDPAICFISSDFSSGFFDLPAGSSFIIQNHGDGSGYPKWVYARRAVAPPVCIGDLDGDGDTDVLDFGEFASDFGRIDLAPGTGGDMDNDGDCDVFDFGLWSSDFGCGT